MTERRAILTALSGLFLPLIFIAAVILAIATRSYLVAVCLLTLAVGFLLIVWYGGRVYYRKIAKMMDRHAKAERWEEVEFSGAELAVIRRKYQDALEHPKTASQLRDMPDLLDPDDTPVQ